MAGEWYPKDTAALRRNVNDLLSTDDARDTNRVFRAGVSPLGHYRETGDLIGRLVGRIPAQTRRVVVVTAWHPTFDHLPEDRRAMSGRVSIVDKVAYETPLGAVPLDAAAQRLRTSGIPFDSVAAAHYWEPGIEALLPFLQCHLEEGFTLVPLVVDAQADATVVADALSPLLGDEQTCLLVSASLLDREGRPRDAEDEQKTVTDLVAGRDESLRRGRGMADRALQMLVRIARKSAWNGTLVAYERASPDKAGQAAVAFYQDTKRNDLLQMAAQADWKDPATKAAFKDALQASRDEAFQGQPLGPPEQQLLLGLARKTIAAKLAGADLPPAPLYSDTLSQKRGCFVTLKKDGALRGCLGIIAATHPLALTVQRYAIAAALEDKRFEPVTEAELPDLTIEINVLTVPQTIEYRDADDLLAKLKPNEHGVVLTYKGQKKATYLPQVWDEIPRKDLFLAHLCRKGGMPADAWKNPDDMQVEVYTDFMFGDADR